MAGTLGDPGGDDAAARRATHARPGPGARLASSLGREQPGRYQLRRELARGGQGVVSVAWDAHLGREVAFKQLLVPTARPADGSLTPSEVRFVREARITAQLDHPGIAPLYEVGLRADGSLYATQRLVSGRTLTAALAACPTPADRLTLLPAVLSVCQTVGFAHRRGVLHRDLKPDNILVSDAGQAVVLDWGLGRTGEEAGTLAGPGVAVDSLLEPGVDRTQAGMLLGTPTYMSPEQAAGDGTAVDARSDVWSLGVVLYQVLTGRRPFEGPSSAEVLRAVATQPLRPVRSVCPEVPAELARLAEAALCRDPAGRPADAAALATELAAALAADPATPSGPGRTSRQVRVGLALAGAVALALGGWSATRPREGLALGPAATPTTRPSIAVLPFSDLSEGHDQEYFADGVAEEILNALAHVEGLRVPGRTSSFWFKGRKVELREIAEKLGVTHVLEGSVRRAGRRLRVTAQVVEVATDAHLWSETFDRDQADIFAVQDQVARAVVEALRVKLLPGARQPSSGARTASLEAYDQYLLGTQRLARYSPEDSDRGIEALERAVALDPALAPAWASLAAGLAMRYEDVQTPEGREGRRRATEAADRAVTLRPDLAEAYAARSRTRHQFQWDVAGAEQDIARAVALAPSNPTVLVTQCLIQWGRGRQDEAAAACRKAVEVDPLSARAWQYLTLTSEARGDLRQARRENDRTRELASGDWILWTTCELDLAEDDRTGPRDACAAFADPRYAALWRAVIASRRGPPAEAERQYAEFVARYGEGNTYMTAQLAAWTGAKERALELLERAYRARSSEFGKVGVDLSFRCLASDPRFQALVAKVSSPLDQGRSR